MPHTVPALAAAPALPGPVLGIDTSTTAQVGVLAPGRDGIVGGSDDPRGQVEELTPLIGGVLATAGLRAADLAAIAVGTGPAPYTGLRIGLATARALGWALDLPVWGVSALDALAADAAARLALPPGTRLLATGDAKRREIFWALYVVDDDGALLAADGPAVGAAAEAPLAEVVVGGGARLYPEILPLTSGGPVGVDPIVLARIAWARAAAGLAQGVEPVYLRRPDVAPPAPPKRVTA